MKTRIVYLIVGLLMITSLKGQVKIGDNPQNINPASVLELESTNRVLVITRVTDAQMSTINPLRGALVYNTDQECIHYFNGTEWINICEALDNSFTVSTQAVFNTAPDSRDSTVVVTQTETPDGINYNFEVNRITGDNIYNRTIYGVDLAFGSISELELQNGAVALGKLANGTSAGQLMQWDGTQWTLISETDITVSPDWANINNIPADIADGDADNQNLSIGSGGTPNQSVEVAISGGTSAIVDVRDADFDPTNENQTVSQGTGITVSQTGQNFQVTNAAPDQIVGLADGGSGNVTIGGAYPNFTIDVPDNTDSQNLSIGAGGTPNQSVEVAISGGTSAIVDVRDADFDPNNEIQDAVDVNITDGAGNFTATEVEGALAELAASNAADGDTDDQNEIQDAVDVNIGDVAGNFTATEVEGALAELAASNAADGDTDSNNENQTVSPGEGISVSQTAQDFEVAVTNPVIALGRITAGTDTSSGATVVNNAGGSYTVTLSTTPAPTNYVIQLTANSAIGVRTIQVINQTATDFSVQIYDDNGAPADSDWYYTVIAF